MLINNLFGLKGSIVLSSKDGNLSRHSHQKSEKNLSSFIMKLAFSIVFVSVLFTSCTQDDDDFLPIEEQQQLKSSDPTLGEATTMSIPTGWTDQGTNTAGGIRRYYNSSKKWYVIKVFLPEIRVTPMSNIVAGTGTSNPTFEKKNISSWRSDPRGLNAIMLINASYYNLDNDPFHINYPYGLYGSKAEVAHPFGNSGSMTSLGYEYGGPNQQRLRIHNQLAYIENNFSTTSFETLIGGYDISENKDKYNSIGRTVVGVPSNGSNTIYFFITGSGGGATQAQAKSALQGFGCTKYVMFDGSGSSQMSWQGSMLVNSTDPIARHIPVFLRMYRR